jgi:hypothetical protein
MKAGMEMKFRVRVRMNRTSVNETCQKMKIKGS